MELAYKTIEMGDPRGKAKVYFSCHPDDVDRAFEGVTDDVLRHAACAIWYDAKPSSTSEELTAAEREEFLAILGDMQLVVIATSCSPTRSSGTSPCCPSCSTLASNTSSTRSARPSRW